MLLISGMCKCMVPDTFVAFLVDALGYRAEFLGLQSDAGRTLQEAFSCLRMSRIFGVHCGSGPSSKVMATRLSVRPYMPMR